MTNGGVSWEIYRNQFGRVRVFVSFPYDRSLVEKIHALNWDLAHQKWDPERRGWCFDLNKYVLGFLANVLSDREFSELIRDVEDFMNEKTIEISLKGNRGKIVSSVSDSLLQRLYDKLAFQPVGFEYSEKFLNGEWDGWIRLFNLKYRSFPVGLLSLVVEELQKEGFKVRVRDLRTTSVNIVEYWWNEEFKLREYQEKIVQRAIEQGQGTILSPTGAGKTLMALKIIEHLHLPTLILVHRKELFYQWQQEIVSKLGVVPAMYGEGKYEEGDITVAMLQTVYSRPLSRNYDVIVVDEVHHIPADTFQKVVSQMTAKYRYGLSATPWREDGKEMLIWGQVGNIIKETTVEALVEQGFLAKPRFLTIEGGIGYGSTWNEEYLKAITDPKRTQRIVELIKKLHQKGFKIYIDVLRIEHGRQLTEALNKAGVSAEWICGQDPSERRLKVLSAFEKDGFVLVSTLIKEGVDLPQMNAIVLAGGGKSGVRVIQTIGRALRPKKGSNEALIIDVKDKGKYLSEHFKQRQGVMRRYYGKLYEEGQTTIEEILGGENAEN